MTVLYIPITSTVWRLGSDSPVDNARNGRNDDLVLNAFPLCLVHTRVSHCGYDFCRLGERDVAPW